MKAAKQVGNVVRAILIVVSVAGGAPWVLAQSPAAKQRPVAIKPVATTAKANPAEKPAGGPQEGIKVHGHWVIEVRNPDGALATRREFENSLTDPRFLVQLLTRQISAGPWIVVLFAASGTTQPCASGGTNAGCGLFEGTPQGALSGIAVATTALTVTPFLTTPFRFELQGTVTATANSTINAVETEISQCPANVAPATPCANASGPVTQFTRATGLAFAPVPVVAGQIIQVKVAISFS